MKKVLIVDDDRDLLYGLQVLLTHKGYIIQTIDDGNEARNTTLKFHPDIIILDVHFPNLNGMNICELLKSNAITSHIPILMISADAEFNEIRRGCQADAFLPKPLRLITLYDQLEQLTA